MKKHLLILAPVFLFAVFPAFASQDDKQNRGKDKKQDAPVVRELNSNRGESVDSDAKISNEDCDPEGEWKNHGQYVSCVSKQGRGGKAVSEAARSDVGKKDKSSVSPSTAPSAAPTSTLSITPSDMPSLTPSASPSEIPSTTPSASPSVILSPSPEGTVTVDSAQLQSLITALEGIVEFLKNLL